MDLHFRQYGRSDDQKQKHMNKSSQTEHFEILHKYPEHFLIHMAELIVREILRGKKKDKARIQSNS